MILVGIAGPKRSGKDTAARYLVDHHGFMTTSFAAPLRSFCCDVYGIDFDELDATKESAPRWLATSPREFMQRCGTEFARWMIDPDLWVKSAMRRVQRCPDANWVLPDVRFANEAEAIRDHGGIVLRMRGRGEFGDSHISESPLPAALVDFEIDNSGDLGWMHEQLDTMLERVSGRAVSEV